MADLQFSHRSNGFKSQSNDVSATVTGKIANGNGYSGKNGYGDVFGGPPKFTVPSFASDIDEYSEIFRSFSDSRNCSVPFLEFPVHDGENIEVSGGSLSSTFAYSDIFGSFDGDVVVPYEDLFGEPKGSRNQCRVPPDSKEKGFSGEISSKNIWNPVETKSCHQSPTVVPSVSLEEPNTEAFASLEKNSFSASVASDHLQDGVKQVNMPSPKTSQRNIEDAIDGTSHICQTYTVSGFTSDTCAPLRNTVSDQTLPPVIDDLSLNADFSEEILEEKHTRKPMPPNPASNNFLKPLLGSKSTAVEEAPYASNQWHSHDSPHDLTSGGDKHNSNGTFLTVSDINLRTKPTRVPPPTRLPPKLVTKWGASEKMMAANLKASGVKEDLHEPEMINQHHQFGGGAETCIVEEVSSQSSPPFLDVEIDASSAAAASAAAMKEAMERAEARIKSAKHSMEKKRDIKGRENGGIKGRERMGCPIAEENHRNKEHTAWEVGEGEDRGTKDRIRDERRKAVKTAQVAPDVQERERKLELAQESMERKLVKDLGVGRDAHEQGNKAGEWKAGKKFYEWEETEKKFKAAEDFFELGKKEKKLNAATEDCKHEASEKKLVAAKENHEHGENVNKFKAAKDALEHEEYEKRLKASVDARQQEENEKRLKAAQVAREREESEKKLKATQEAQEREENEKKLKLAQEACELEENRRKLKLAQEAREREENERKLKLAQEVREQEENERKLKLAEAREWEEKERKLKLAQEAREQEESDKKLKLAQEACEREENERKLKLAEEAREREENERKLKLAQETRELEENERRLKLVQEAREREENEWKLKVAQEACEWEENERKLKLVQGTHEREENERKLKFAQEACEWEENERMLKLAQEPREREGNEWKLKQAQEDSEQEEHERKIKLAQETHESDENVWKLKLAQEDSKLDENEKKLGVAQRVSVWEEKNGIPKPFQEFCKSEGTDRKVKTIDEAHEIEEHKKEQQEKMKVQQEREQEKERLRKIEEEKEREREREKDRLAVERATREARERAFVEARERAERASAEARERASMEARLRVERAAVDRATAEARERAMERVLAEKAAMEARERAERSIAERFAAALRDRQRKGNDPGEFVGNCTRTNGGMRQNPASEFEHDLQFQSTIPSNGSYQRNSDATNYGLHSIEKFQEAEGELSMRHKAKLERQHRTDERAAKALSEKKLRDILAQREQAERNRLAETLDADVRRWSMGKAGNLRALLSTLQYILWPESGWQPVPLTDVITAAAVKKAYRKATLCVHPDKVQQRGASIQQKYISEKVFDLLKEAWNKFNSEER